MANRWGKVKAVTDCIFLSSKITVDGDCRHEVKRHLLFGRKAMTNLDSILKSRDITLLTKVCGFSSSHAQMWELDHKEDSTKELMLLNYGAGEDSWESLGLQGDQISQSWKKLTLNTHWKDWCWSWVSNTWTSRCKEPTHWKRPWCWERLRAGGEGDEDEMAAWHHWLNGCESGWTPGVGDGQGRLACCDSWGRKESDMTERLNWSELN